MGLIPAYAGRTKPWKRLPIQRRAHPRLRGADQVQPASPQAHGGSSPLTRGGPTSRMSVPRSSGLIPAYAGRTSPFCPRKPRGKAHPRLRGADVSCCGWVSGWVGSSPLTRGGLIELLPPLCRARLIPAYAGRTPKRARPEPNFGAHPRLRGADGGKVTCPSGASGSSPLTRGGLIATVRRNPPGGLIPAYAGRTLCRPWRGSLVWAHPRLRGADAPLLHDLTAGLGSSPLTRGGP